MEWRWTETHGGRRGAATLSNYDDKVGAGSDFWTVSVADPGADQVFDFAVYSRRAMALQALRNRIGDQSFWKVLRTWIHEQNGGNGATEQFEPVAARVSVVILTLSSGVPARPPSRRGPRTTAWSTVFLAVHDSYPRPMTTPILRRLERLRRGTVRPRRS